MGACVFKQINIISGDPDRSSAFYQLLGVRVPQDASWRTPSGTHHISVQRAAAIPMQVEIDSTLFASVWGTQGLTNGTVVVDVEVATREEVDVAVERVKAAGFEVLRPPADMFWGARFAMVQDPDGIPVGIMSPVVAEYRTPPPDL